ncbi:MAG: CDP-glucose 4,6-dehydratase, partial [Actinomycetota bacterium]
MGTLSRAFDNLKGKRVVVTGDTGFKGSWLSLWLHDLGAEVFGFALPPDGPVSHFDQLGLRSLIDHVDGDV